LYPPKSRENGGEEGRFAQYLQKPTTGSHHRREHHKPTREAPPPSLLVSAFLRRTEKSGKGKVKRETDAGTTQMARTPKFKPTKNQTKNRKKPDNKTTLNGGGEENDALRFTPQK
jgi:hypothetical protein